jgi:anti-sigma factor (TIGR02949 family)
MLTCEAAIELLSEYLEAMLTAETLAELEAHLAACPPCVAYLNTFRRTRELAAAAGRVEMPEELKLRLREVLRRLGSAPR